MDIIYIVLKTHRTTGETSVDLAYAEDASAEVTEYVNHMNNKPSDNYKYDYIVKPVMKSMATQAAIRAENQATTDRPYSTIF